MPYENQYYSADVLWAKICKTNDKSGGSMRKRGGWY